MSIQLQYTLVGAIILIALLWMIRGIIRANKKHGCKSKEKNPACGGCALSDACNSSRKTKD